MIARDVSLLRQDQLGVTAIVSVTLEVETPQAYADFDRQMQADTHVMQAYHVSGTTDYLLIVQGPTLAWYEQWAKDTLMSNANLKRHDSNIVYSCKKFEISREI